MANNFEAAAFALQCAFPKNKILMDDKGMPSIFVWIPAFRLCDVLSTTSTDIHPAFRVNGKGIAGFYFGKYQTKVYNERAYSLPAEDPTVSQNFDWFASKTKANGTGWHEATVAEWAAVALWCHKRGCEPRGNNNYQDGYFCNACMDGSRVSVRRRVHRRAGSGAPGLQRRRGKGCLQMDLLGRRERDRIEDGRREKEAGYQSPARSDP